jgi:hypothetical protein
VDHIEKGFEQAIEDHLLHQRLLVSVLFSSKKELTPITSTDSPDLVAVTFVRLWSDRGPAARTESAPVHAHGG